LKVADSSNSAEDRGYSYDHGWNLVYRSAYGGYTSYTVDAKNQLVTAGTANCTYDANGNLVGFGGSSTNAYFYDDENRLIVITNGLNVANGTNPPPQFGPSTGELVQSPSPPQPTGGWKAEFTYDGLGRLRIRKDYYAYSSGFYLTNTTLYIYDGNRVIQERNAGDVPTVSYTRGTDLSGSLEGAGGIGGLLARSSGYSSGNWTSHAYYHADGNVNITALVDSSQALVATYRYDPYGNLLSLSGTLAGANLYRFSSKEFHVNSGLYYYLYRFYAPNLQRWMNRDPIGESGFERTRAILDSQLGRAAPATSPLPLNQYGFVSNDPAGRADADGLADTALCAVLKALMKATKDPDRWEALNKVFQNMCVDPPKQPTPGRPAIQPEFWAPFDPSWNRRWECVRGGPPLRIDQPFQFPELEPSQTTTIIIGGGALIALPVLVGGGSGGAVIWPILAPAF